MIKETIFNDSGIPRIIFTDFYVYTTAICFTFIFLLTVSHVLIMLNKRYGSSNINSEVNPTLSNDYKDYLFLIFLVIGMAITFFSTSTGFNLILPTLLKFA